MAPSLYLLRVLQHPVLERHQRGVRADQRPDLLQHVLEIPELDAHHHQVHRPHFPGMRRRVHRRHVDGMRSSLHAEPVATHRLEMGSTCDESDVCAPLTSSAPKKPPSPPAPTTAMRITTHPRVSRRGRATG